MVLPIPSRLLLALIALPFLVLSAEKAEAADACARWSADVSLYTSEGRGWVASVCGTAYETPTELLMECRGADAFMIRYAPGYDGEEPKQYDLGPEDEEAFRFATEDGGALLTMRYEPEADVFFTVLPVYDLLIEEMKAGLRLKIDSPSGLTPSNEVSLIGSRLAIDRVARSCLDGRIVAP